MYYSLFEVDANGSASSISNKVSSSKFAHDFEFRICLYATWGMHRTNTFAIIKVEYDRIGVGAYIV